MRAAASCHVARKRQRAGILGSQDIDEIKENITAANLARKIAHDVGDASAKAAAIRQQLMATRRAVALLDADPSSPLTLKQLGTATSLDCVALARLSDEQFAARIVAVASRAVAALRAPRPAGTCPQIKMAITPWFRDGDGVLTRTSTAVDDETAKANGGPQLEQT